MTTHEYARLLLADIDCPTDWPLCRACGKRMAPGSGVSTGASSIAEGTFKFHHGCYDNLSAEQKMEASLIRSKLFRETY